jgi:hypothetical protein
MSNNQSEVRRLLEQIDAEYAAAKRGLTGLAQGVSQHEFITKRMERVSELHSELSEIVGSREEAMRLMVEHQERSSS